MRFHDLRHFCVASLIAEGAHPKAIQTRLGHSSVMVTMDTYGHLLPSLDDELSEGLDRQFRETAASIVRPIRGQLDREVQSTSA